MERYTRIFSLPTNLYAEGSLVILEAGALLKDNANNTMLAQLKFKNVDPQAIKMLKVEIIPKDSMGRNIEPATAYQYLDLQVCRNDSFGSKQAIALPDSTVRSFDVKVLEIGLEDNTIVKGSDASWDTLPNPKKLDDSELSKQCRIAYGNDFKYEAAEYGDLWYCACGALNRKNEDACHKCSRTFKRLSDSDIQELTAAMELRLAEEKHQRELAEQKCKEEEAEAERIREIREAEAAVRKKKTSKIIALFGVAVAAVVAVFLLVTKVVMPTQQYNAAIALKDAGQYEEAISAFEAMDGYKDSLEQIAECRIALMDIDYNHAVALKNDGKYEEAIAIFESLDGYKDSAVQIEACQIAIEEASKEQQYSSAVALMNAEKYEEAIAVFETVIGYKDSGVKIKECKCAITYEDAVAQMQDGNYLAAYEAFSRIRDYKDVGTLLATDEHLKVEATYQLGNYVTFGTYEQDNNKSNGAEEIEWLVLARDGSKVLLLSRYGLDTRPYNTKKADITYEKSTLRSWLNGPFLNTAFSKESQERIQMTHVTADKNPDFSTAAGKAVSDKVFLLSIAEIEKYISRKESRGCAVTDYTKAQGAFTSDEYSVDGKASCNWWLRTPGAYSYYATVVNCKRNVGSYGSDVSNITICVRPALWLELNP